MGRISAELWATYAMTSDTPEEAWLRVAGDLADAGFDGVTLVCALSLDGTAEMQPQHKFGVFIDEEWEGRVRTEPDINTGDPIARRFLARELPLHVRRGNPLFRSMSESEQAFYRHYDEHGVRAGAVWPVHDRRAGVVHLLASWTGTSATEYAKALSEMGSEIHLATAFFCEALRARELAADARVSLSPRERECLLWVQAGRSTQQIADVLGIADATVVEYIGTAMRKLGASNRMQAAGRAMAIGLLRP